jgi:hypothetical protein
LHLIVIARKVEKQNIFLRRENQPQFQIRPALKSVWRNFSDAQAAVDMWPPKIRPNFLQRCHHLGFSADDAFAEAG